VKKMITEITVLHKILEELKEKQEALSKCLKDHHCDCSIHRKLKRLKHKKSCLKRRIKCKEAKLRECERHVVVHAPDAPAAPAAPMCGGSD